MTDGERWVRDALAELRAGGLGPAGLARFLAASWRRASERRAARPELVRQARTWAGAGALAWVVPAALGVDPFRERLPSGLAWWGLTALMLDWHLGMVETEAGHPRSLGAADAFTLGRAWLVPLAAAGPAPVVCALAFASDVLDGVLARAAEPTRMGRDLEGAVDAAFTTAAVAGAVAHGRLGRGPAALEATRQAGGAAVALYAYFGRGAPPDPRLAHAARATSPVRAAGILAAAAGHRRAADVLVAGGAVAGALAAFGARAPVGGSSARRFG